MQVAGYPGSFGTGRKQKAPPLPCGIDEIIDGEDKKSDGQSDEGVDASPGKGHDRWRVLGRQR
jgi:hypothetical protein